MTPAQRHMDLVARAGCVLGNRGLHLCEHLPGEPRVTVHHVAEGTSKRSDFATVGLCWGGHQGPGGIHGMGVKAFVKLYRVPWEKEEGLLVWANEDIARLRVQLDASRPRSPTGVDIDRIHHKLGAVRAAKGG